MRPFFHLLSLQLLKWYLGQISCSAYIGQRSQKQSTQPKSMRILFLSFLTSEIRKSGHLKFYMLVFAKPTKYIQTLSESIVTLEYFCKFSGSIFNVLNNLNTIFTRLLYKVVILELFSS